MMKRLLQGMKALLGYLISLGVIAALFALINVVLVGGQKLWHHGDQIKLDTIRNELATQGADIAEREQQLVNLQIDLDSKSVQIDGLKSRAKSIEQANPSGVPADIYASYTQLIERCNSSVEKYNESLAQYNAFYSDYSQRIDEYNNLVTQSNDLSKKLAVWYVFPIPVPALHKEPNSVRPSSIEENPATRPAPAP